MSGVEEWLEPPQMDTGAPMPGVMAIGPELYLAYIVGANEPSELEDFAVVRFSGVLQHIFGYPNDEALGGHALFKLGLKFYAFNLIEDSPYLRELGERNAKVFPGTESIYEGFRHWIVTLHDQTLEVIARSAEVVGRVEARDALSAINWHIERGTSSEAASNKSGSGG